MGEWSLWHRAPDMVMVESGTNLMSNTYIHVVSIAVLFSGVILHACNNTVETRPAAPTIDKSPPTVEPSTSMTILDKDGTVGAPGPENETLQSSDEETDSLEMAKKFDAFAAKLTDVSEKLSTMAEEAEETARAADEQETKRKRFPTMLNDVRSKTRQLVSKTKSLTKNQDTEKTD